MPITAALYRYTGTGKPCLTASVNLISPVFFASGIYPYHFMVYEGETAGRAAGARVAHSPREGGQLLAKSLLLLKTYQKHKT